MSPLDAAPGERTICLSEHPAQVAGPKRVPGLRSGVGVPEKLPGPWPSTAAPPSDLDPTCLHLDLCFLPCIVRRENAEEIMQIL